MIIISLIILLIGTILITVSMKKIVQKLPKVIYRYIPRTFKDEQVDSFLISDIFDTLFSQQSPWLDSVRTYDSRKQEKINKYFVSQM